MKIPNEEISYIYKNNIREWFLQCIGKQDLSGLVKVFEEGDCETASDIIKSNRESGNGRYDLTLKTKRIRKGKVIILEFKVMDNINKLEKGCMEALEQIERLHYDNDIIEEGYTDILKYGICFYKKECFVMNNMTANQGRH